MERFTISKSEKQTIYEIYRACRLCGAGGGYRMPIIQNIIDLESSEVELSQKIQECLQLEVRQDDRMPPLICELCVDKVNDFYKFFTLARQTNVTTRTRLGLPLHMAKKGEPEQSDCILGVTEPVYVKDDEPPAKKSRAGPKCSKNIKKEPDVVKVKVRLLNTETVSDSSRSSSVSSRSSRARAASPPRAAPPRASPPRVRPPARDRRGKAEPAQPAQQTPKERDRRTPKERKSEIENLLDQTPKERDRKTPRERKSEIENLLDLTPKEKEKKTTKERKSEIQYLLEDNLKFEDSLPPRGKRTRDEPPRPTTQPKRTKAPPPKEPEKEASPPRSRPGPKSRKPAPKAEPQREPPQKQDKAKAKAKPEPAKAKEAPKPAEEETPKTFKCLICDAQLKTQQAHTNHTKSHTANYTKPSNACNPCEEWFPTAEEAAAHHRHHRMATFPYHCRRCFGDFTTLQLYNDHISQGACRPWQQQPDVKCSACWGSFATDTLRRGHKCPGEDGRPGGKCPKCCRTYATAKNLRRHECKAKKRRDLIADPDVLRRLKPMQVRIRRCDGLFSREVDGRYDVSDVKPNYGLAKRYIYPYLKFSPVKTEPLHSDSMVAIPVALKEEFATDYTHWDSEDSDVETILRRVPSLSILAIKKLFSKHCLGKVPRRRKRVKNEAFENDNDFGNIGNINDLISSLGDDVGNVNLGKKDLAARIKDIIGCFDDSMDDGVNLDGNDNGDKIVDEGSKSKKGGNLDGNDNDDKIVDEGSKSVDEGGNLDGNDNDDKIVDEGSKSMGEGGNLDGNDNDDKIVDEGSKDGNVTSCNGDVNSGGNVNDSTKESFIQSDERNDSEKESVEISRTAESSDNVITNDESNHNNEENENLNRPETETGNLDLVDKEIGVSLQESTENLIEMATETKVTENVTVNGIECKSNCTEETKSEESSKQANKESPIKHSIENLIGDTDKNPDKYISEVISSIEDIINKNPRNEDTSHEQLNSSNVMDVLDNISEDKEKRISDSDKITLEDLLPKEDRQMELDDISDEDFNFDA